MKKLPGRPPLPPGEVKRVQVNIRMDASTAAALEAAKSDWGSQTLAAAALRAMKRGLPSADLTRSTTSR